MDVQTISAAVPPLSRNHSKQGSNTASLLARLKKAWTAYAEHRPIYEECCAQVDELLFTVLLQLGKPPFENGQFTEVSKRADKECRRTFGFDKEDKKQERLSQRVFDVAKEILNLEAHSVDDLALIANLVATEHAGLWEKDFEHLDPDEQFVRKLVDSVLDMAGESRISEGLPVTQKVVCGAWQRASEVMRRPDYQALLKAGFFGSPRAISTN